MKQKYKSIMVKEEVHESLKKAANLLNRCSLGTSKHTMASLISSLAVSYDTQMTAESIISNEESWIIDGVPIILNSDGAKHFRELLYYLPDDATDMVSNYIRTQAMELRYQVVTNAK